MNLDVQSMEEISAGPAAPATTPPAQPSDDGRARPVTIIRPRTGWQPADLLELWRFRGLLWIFALRDVKVRYKQTAIGALWAILQPLTTATIFYLIFEVLLNQKLTTSEIPYVIFTYCGLLPWQLFANSMSQSAESLVANQGLINKIYFPRLLLPIAPTLAGLVDFAIGFVGLLVLMAIAGIVPGLAILTVPFFVALAVLAALSVGIWLSALCANYRDFRHTIPFIMQIWFFATPVFYNTRAAIPERYQALYGLNPMAGVIEGFRWALFGENTPPGPLLLVSVVAMIGLLMGGLWYFRRMERTFADWV